MDNLKSGEVTDLDIQKQEEALAGLTQEEKHDAIEKILKPIPVHQKEDAKNWIDSQLKRSKDQKGLNHVDALLYAVAHGGTLISHAAYDAWAKKDPSVYEDKTWTWYFHDLLEAMSSGFAPYGDRRRGRANRCERDADRRGAYRGGRVAGLRVQIS